LGRFDVLGFATLIVVGFTACAATANLRPRYDDRVRRSGDCECQRLRRPRPQIWRWLGAASLVLALVTTIIVNVPINLATSTLDPAVPPSDWRVLRDRWELFQGVRSWLLLLGFVLICVGFAIG